MPRDLTGRLVEGQPCGLISLDRPGQRPAPAGGRQRHQVRPAGDCLGQSGRSRDSKGPCPPELLGRLRLVVGLQVDGLGQERHDHHRQEQDEEQGTGELGHDHGDERILARAAELGSPNAHPAATAA